MKKLVTGFESFNGATVNHSEQIVYRFCRSGRSNLDQRNFTGGI